MKAPHKYEHLWLEPMNPGHQYATYREQGQRRRAPAKRALMARLRLERKERIKRTCRIKIPKIRWDF